MNIGRTLAGALSLTLLSVSAEPAQACRFFDRLCGKPTTTFYAPVAAPQPVCCARPVTCCAQRPVVSYMPQTAYRTVYVNRPVVSYQPATACDACGRATTVMRPVTSYVRQAQMVPYTTYRPVVTSAPQPQACCGAPTATTVTYAPAVSSVQVAAPAPAPSCCGGGSTTTVTPAPSLSSSSTIIRSPATTAPATTTPTPSLGTPVPTPDPSLNAPSTAPAPTTTPQTFESNGGTQSRVLMPPYPGPASTNTIRQPQGLDPEGEDRMTAIPLRPQFTVRQASLVVPAKTQPKPLDDGGWRAAGR
ncbi:MAG: hypothetical protein DWQ37_09565 [Planctomycetota bacterium]|nr:MAG: hypothetical protein DWQ37_09565 [Planctomycetota bacterium]